MDLTLVPTNTALLVIDVQNGLFTKPTPIHQAAQLLASINQLSTQFRIKNAPVVLIQHSNQKLLVKGSQNWQLHPDLVVEDGDLRVHKTHGNAFKDTELKSELDARGILSLVVTGLVTNGCVRATCIGGHELGYRVVLVLDGHSTYTRDARQVIEEWNRVLGQEVAELYPAAQIRLVG